MVDINLGAYLLDNLRERCENCRSLNSPQWRKGWYSTELCRKVTLCNACGIKFAKKQFCCYCMEIYSATANKMKYWLKCYNCKRYSHTLCEKNNKKGIIKSRRYVCYQCRH